MDRQDSARRLLLVHAHPDDESIGTGATIARYAAEGAQVTLVTCTLGELGEVIPPELAHLATDGDRLGEHRITELAAACAALGISDQRFLGGPGRWRDSGMMGLPSNDDPDCFWQADLATAAAELAQVILDVRPQVLVTYDENGFYGHPDHIQAHRVASAAIALAAAAGGRSPSSTPPRCRSRWPWPRAWPTSCPSCPTSRSPPRSTAAAYLAAKTAAMRAHATQIVVDCGRFALSNGRWQPLLGQEFYTLLAGPPGAAPGTREHDLFAGLDGR